MMPPGIEAEPSEKFAISRNQVAVLGLVLILIGVFLSGRQFGWFGEFRNEPIAIPSGTPYAEARVVGAYEGVVLAERTAATDAQGNPLQKKLEILTDEGTVFATLTSSGPVKVSYTELSEGDTVWVYKRIRPFGEPADMDLAIPFEDMLKNPRERLRADFVVLIGK